MSDQGPEAPKDYAESVKSAAGSALDQAQGAYRQASGEVQNATGQMADLIRDQPLIAVGAAFVIGIIVATLWPALEDEGVGDGLRARSLFTRSAGSSQ